MSDHKIVDYYECKGCKHRVAEIDFIQARFNYQCNGKIFDGRRCDWHLGNYKPIYKDLKEK